MHAHSRKLPIALRHLTRRYASSSTNPFPYPVNANPTPQQIFHLPLDATQQQVKDRYYELVKIYHPDSSVSQAYGPDVSQARFHSVTHAYDILRGRKRPTDGRDSDAGLRPDYHDLSSAVWRAKQQRRADLNIPHDDRWKDRIFIGAVVLALGVFVVQTSVAKQRNLRDWLHSAEAGRPSGTPRAEDVSRRDEELLSAPDSGRRRT
ncbi:hypothetical protein FA95DRAFT_1551618 [Auriscalpium vulgare]|uniref:Uncharacterized protein n=1 Tax=Auriscalpium vulgare TaxID=40419 RepID=A0ACB8SDC6_9AGAM|nr:hypothetical protein FA95DRAFT_1551618 [Auriscalpium vulgare]